MLFKNSAKQVFTSKSAVTEFNSRWKDKTVMLAKPINSSGVLYIFGFFDRIFGQVGFWVKIEQKSVKSHVN